MRIIAITGASRAGKSTTADILCTREDYKHYSFANSLKLYCANVYSGDRSELGWNYITEDWTGPKTVKGRQFLQKTADAKRAEEPYFFINSLLDTIKYDNFNHGIEVAVIDDTRFINELNLLFEFRQPILRLENTLKEVQWLIDYQAGEPAAIHMSEVEWRLWCQTYPYYLYHIYNNSTKDILKLQLDRFLDYSENFSTAPEVLINDNLELELL